MVVERVSLQRDLGQWELLCWRKPLQERCALWKDIGSQGEGSVYMTLTLGTGGKFPKKG